MWLLEASVRLAIAQAVQAGFSPSAEQLTKFEARFRGEDSEGGGRILTVVGETAEIAVKGVITEEPDFMAMLFGGGNVLYPEITAAIATAEADNAVNDVIFAVKSPGGTTDGLFDAMAAIQAMKKPSKTVASDVLASAAYGLASQTGSIKAKNRATRIGSIGVATAVKIDDREVVIASTKAPKKVPDVQTPEGRAVVREELDALHGLFAEAIADGRGTTTEKVNAEFGQGAVLLADAALEHGMIDAIAGNPLRAVTTKPSKTASAGGGKLESKNMNLAQLQTEHPDVYAAAVERGTTAERDRVSAHLTMGEASGDLKTASAAIKDGSAMTATLQATYMTAGMNRSDVDNRQADDKEANAGDNAHKPDGDDKGPADTVAGLVEAKLGINPEA